MKQFHVLILLCFCAILGACRDTLPPQPITAKTGTGSGRIFYSSNLSAPDDGIFSVQPDGSGRSAQIRDNCILWSFPRAGKVAFVQSQYRVVVSDIDGNNAIVLSANPSDRITDAVLSPDGDLVVYQKDTSGAPGWRTRLIVSPSTGGPSRSIPVVASGSSCAAFSPDEKIAFYGLDSTGFTTSLYSFDPKTNITKRLVFNIGRSDMYKSLPGTTLCLDWSPDGRSIVFMTQGPNDLDISITDSAGTNPVRVVDNNTRYDPAFSPDGNSVVFCEQYDRDKTRVQIMDLGNLSFKSLLDVETHHGQGQDNTVVFSPRWSPDGKKILCVVNESLCVLDPLGPEIHIDEYQNGSVPVIGYNVRQEGGFWVP